jgi:hypothetical protein
MQFSFHHFHSLSVYSEPKDAYGLVISWSLLVPTWQYTEQVRQPVRMAPAVALPLLLPKV